MLEKLSGFLKKSIDKINTVLFVDTELIESIVKDMQRALLSAPPAQKRPLSPTVIVVPG